MCAVLCLLQPVAGAFPFAAAHAITGSPPAHTVYPWQSEQTLLCFAVYSTPAAVRPSPIHEVCPWQMLRVVL
jgi:hypothetical protein